jgi:hypothetical protein
MCNTPTSSCRRPSLVTARQTSLKAAAAATAAATAAAIAAAIAAATAATAVACSCPSRITPRSPQVIQEYYATNDPLERRASCTAAAGKKPVANPLARKTIQVAGEHVLCLPCSNWTHSGSLPECHRKQGKSYKTRVPGAPGAWWEKY